MKNLLPLSLNLEYEDKTVVEESHPNRKNHVGAYCCISYRHTHSLELRLGRNCRGFQ